VQNDFGIRRRLTDGAAGNKLPAQRQAVGEVAVMGDGDAADFQFREKRLHVAQRHFAGGGVARVADRHVARQFGDRHRVGIMVADEAHMLFSMELLAVEGDDAGRLLAAMLEGVQPERRQGGCFRMAENAEDAALFVKRVAVEIVVVSAGELEIAHCCKPLLGTVRGCTGSGSSLRPGHAHMGMV
jgi:hypothetical protein